MMFLLLLALTHGIERQHIRNAYFEGRSTNVHYAGGSLISGNENIILLSGAEPASSISVMDIGDVMARSFWVGRMQTSAKSKVLNYDLPSADLLMFNFGTDSATYNALPNAETLAQMNKADLTIPFHPADPVSIVTSALTAEAPGTHGVVGKYWTERGSTVEAFSSARRFPSTVGVVNLMSDEYDGLKVTACASDRVLSHALSEGTAASSFVKDGVFVGPQQSLTFTWEKLQTSMKSDPVWASLSEQTATLDLSEPNTQMFLMEMEYLNRLGSSFSGKQMQLFNVATTSMEKMDQTPAVLAIFSTMVDRTVSKFNEAFPTGVAQVAFLETPVMEPHMLEAKLSQRLTGKEFTEVCQQGDVLCFKANQELDGVQYTTYQAAVWTMLAAGLIVLFFSCSFCQMRYTDDALLFTKWKREY